MEEVTTLFDSDEAEYEHMKEQEKKEKPSYIDRAHYCKHICKCNRAKCDRSACPIWNAPAADVVPMKEYGQWILCEERLPKEAGEYLVKGTYKGYTKTWKCQFLSLGGIGGWSNNARNPIVSAWWEPADVVPRAEVAREIFEEIEKLTFVRGFGGDVPNLVIMTAKSFAELKKKYTEEQTNG